MSDLCRNPDACERKGRGANCRRCATYVRLRTQWSDPVFREKTLAGIRAATRRHPKLTEDQLFSEFRRIFNYDPDNGALTWAQKPNKRSPIKIGAVAGIPLDGYIRVSVFNKRYLVHRVIWAIVHGCFPRDQIDHADLDRSNNRIVNLREATQSENMTNRNYPWPIETRGVSYHPKCRKRFAAVVRKDKVAHHLGYFQTPEEAHAAYVAAARRLHGEFARIE